MSAARGRVTSRRVGIWLAGILLLSFVYFLPRWPDWNELARLAMTMAIVNHSTIAIDPYQATTLDKSFYQGHYFSNKAPGQSLVGVPVYAAYKLVVATGVGREAADALQRNGGWNVMLANGSAVLIRPRLDTALVLYLETIITVAVPSTLFLLLFYWFLGYFSDSLLNRALLTLATGLATIVYPYSQVFYSHVPAAALLFAAFVLSHAGKQPAVDGRSRVSPALLMGCAGFCGALAIVFEYPAAIIAGLIAVYAGLTSPRKLLFSMLIGFLPPMAVVLGYNYLPYHDPFTTGYNSYAATYHGDAKGIAGSTWPPRWDALKGMTFSPYRGLFFLSPFLLLAFPGYRLWARRGGREWLLFLSITVLYMVVISMYWSWPGGSTIGPRYLLPMLPFLAFPVIFWLDAASAWWTRTITYGLFGLSLAVVWLETIGGTSGSYPATEITSPLLSFSLPAISRGDIALNLGVFLGLSGPEGLFPLGFAIVLWSAMLVLPAFPSSALSRTAMSPRVDAG